MDVLKESTLEAEAKAKVKVKARHPQAKLYVWKEKDQTTDRWVSRSAVRSSNLINDFFHSSTEYKFWLYRDTVTVSQCMWSDEANDKRSRGQQILSLTTRTAFKDISDMYNIHCNQAACFKTTQLETNRQISFYTVYEDLHSTYWLDARTVTYTHIHCVSKKGAPNPWQ